MHAQRLDTRAPFGEGAEATPAAVSHLGYVQIDTIHVVERCHHHILYSRIPSYRREHLARAQSVEKSVFEYWTHALAYVPTQDIRFFLGAMKRYREAPSSWFDSVSKSDLRRVLKLVQTSGPVSIRDIEDEELVEKDHPWASRKPSKRALQLAFFRGELTVSERNGMIKSYELMERHFGWETRPRAATEAQILDYLLERALRCQGIVSLDSVCYLDAKRKPAIRALIERKLARRQLLAVQIEGQESVPHWATPEAFANPARPDSDLVHILSPFDPLIIQRKRLAMFFGYEHRFEAYVPRDKRVYGYFALPVLIGDRVVAAIDLKTDRSQGKLAIQQWNWVDPSAGAQERQRIEEELSRFERFQLDC